MENRNNITKFILLGLSQKKEIEILCFLLFLLCYIGILIGNLLVMISIASSQLMKQPINFFLSHLSLREADICYTSTVTPKLIADLLARKKTISYHGCMTQLFTMHFFGRIEVFILTGMAFDRYVTICKSLCYTLIMTRQKCGAMITASGAGGFLPSFGQFLLAIFLHYCSPNEIDHYFCDVYPSLKLACTDTTRIGLLVIANSGLMGLVTFAVLLRFYAVILHTVRSYSVENHSKALSTCSSHVTVVVLFISPLFFIYIQSATTYQKTVFSLFYTIIAPMFNPLIYTLRNIEMKNAIKKLWCHITVRKDMN
ncbi:hypothetical protein FD754_006300 [Muntiacus muntjak]|uniref:Olfactory receptor n=1 Tax=Muntiacus muntjak TaxID=9888 RepID=A0A5N3WL13_MUNMU|nr:hypothetical protein FD754_006300 [Muntiacus muntjak]